MDVVARDPWLEAKSRVAFMGSVDKAWKEYYSGTFSRAEFRAWIKSGLL